MPLDKLQSSRWWPWIENGFWIVVFVIAYIAMMKVMHPGYKIFGI